MTEDLARGRLRGESADGPVQLLTVADVRAAIARVAAGEFGVVGRLSWSCGCQSGADVAAEVAVTSAGLLREWSETAEVVGRLRAVETAQLAAFLLNRVLNREGGEGELEKFLTAPELKHSESSCSGEELGEGSVSQARAPAEPPAGSVFAAGSYDDQRLTTRALE